MKTEQLEATKLSNVLDDMQKGVDVTNASIDQIEGKIESITGEVCNFSTDGCDIKDPQSMIDLANNINLRYVLISRRLESLANILDKHI